MNRLKQYIKANVLCRCGHVVSRLMASDLIPRPELPTSESEIHEWWLVSPELADKLRAQGFPVIQFGELNMWGRTSTGVALEDDEDLSAALGLLETPSASPPRSAAKKSAMRRNTHAAQRREASTRARARGRR